MSYHGTTEYLPLSLEGRGKGEGDRERVIKNEWMSTKKTEATFLALWNKTNILPHIGSYPLYLM